MSRQPGSEPSRDETWAARENFIHSAQMVVLAELIILLTGEINQPLTAVIANASACSRLVAPLGPSRTGLAKQDLGEVQAALKDIVQDAQRAGNVARLIRTQVAEALLDRQPVDVNTLLQDVLSLAEPELIGCAVDVHTDLQPDLPFTYGNKLRFQTAIYNLVCNAIPGAASARARVLTAQSQLQDGGHIAVSLVYDGPGAVAAELERELDMFSLVEHDPICLGLWASRSIIQEYAGEISVTRGAGMTTIRVTLPTASATSKSSRPNLSPRAGCDLFESTSVVTFRSSSLFWRAC